MELKKLSLNLPFGFGGIELALIVYIACRLLALIYNSAARSRRDKK